MVAWCWTTKATTPLALGLLATAKNNMTNGNESANTSTPNTTRAGANARLPSASCIFVACSGPVHAGKLGMSKASGNASAHALKGSLPSFGTVPHAVTAVFHGRGSLPSRANRTSADAEDDEALAGQVGTQYSTPSLHTLPLGGLSTRIIRVFRSNENTY